GHPGTPPGSRWGQGGAVHHSAGGSSRLERTGQVEQLHGEVKYFSHDVGPPKRGLPGGGQRPPETKFPERPAGGRASAPGPASAPLLRRRPPPGGHGFDLRTPERQKRPPRSRGGPAGQLPGV